MVKGEPTSWETGEHPTVKEEQLDYDSENEDHKEISIGYNMKTESSLQIRIKKRKESLGESDDDNDENFELKLKKAKKPRSGPPLHSFSRPGTCDACSRECANQGWGNIFAK